MDRWSWHWVGVGVPSLLLQLSSTHSLWKRAYRCDITANIVSSWKDCPLLCEPDVYQWDDWLSNGVFFSWNEQRTQRKGYSRCVFIGCAVPLSMLYDCSKGEWLDFHGVGDTDQTKRLLLAADVLPIRLCSESLGVVWALLPSIFKLILQTKQILRYLGFWGFGEWISWGSSSL